MTNLLENIFDTRISLNIGLTSGSDKSESIGLSGEGSDNGLL